MIGAFADLWLHYNAANQCDKSERVCREIWPIYIFQGHRMYDSVDSGSTHKKEHLPAMSPDEIRYNFARSCRLNVPLSISSETIKTFFTKAEGHGVSKASIETTNQASYHDKRFSWAIRDREGKIQRCVNFDKREIWWILGRHVFDICEIGCAKAASFTSKLKWSNKPRFE